MTPDHPVTPRSRTVRPLAVAAYVCLLAAGACAPRMVELQPALPPAHPDFTYPAVPDALRRTQAPSYLDRGWQLLQRDDRPAAARAFAEALRREPGFYPAMAARGYLALADDRHAAALESFDAALERDPAYVPALLGRGQTLIALDRLDDAAAAFEAAIAADASLEPLRERVEVLHVRRLQALIDTARAAAKDGRAAEARAAYAEALARSPASGFLHLELAEVERAAGEIVAAQRHVRQAIVLDPADRSAWLMLGALHDVRKDDPAALEAYERAAALEPSDELLARIASLRERIADAGLPPEIGTLRSLAAITRADLAALIGVRLEPLIASLPDPAVVLTDIRESWAAPWITRVVAAGVMEPLANHTFQPADPVRRLDLAEVSFRLLRAISGAALAAQPVRAPVIADVLPTHLSFQAISAVVSAGIVPLLDGQQFQGTRAATGAEAIAAVDRLRALWASAR